MISRNYSEKISFITFFPHFLTNAPGLFGKFAIKGDACDRPRHYNMSQLTKKYLPILKRTNQLANKNKKE